MNQRGEREPLLGNSEEGRRRSGNQEQNKANHNVIVKDSKNVSPFIHSLIAIRTGHLPNNLQLYTLFHSLAAFFDSLSSSTISTTSNKSNGYGSTTTTNNQEESSTESQPNETVLTVAALLKECATMSRLSASWLYGNKRKDDDKEVENEGARGNENEQWQRFIWHLGQVLSDNQRDEEQPIEMEMKSELETDFEKTKKNLKKQAEQIKSDSKKGFQSIIKIISFILSSDELLRIPSDFVQHVSQTLASMANTVGVKAFQTEEILENDGVENKEGKDFVYPKEAVQEAATKVADTVEVLVNDFQTEQTKEKGKGKRTSDQTWQDEFAKRITRLLNEINENEQSKQAMNKFVQLTKKYLGIIREIRDDIQIKVEDKGGSIGNVVEDEIDGAREGLATKVESSLLETQVSANLSYHASAFIQACKEVLEGLAGGTSLDLVMKDVKNVQEQIQSDSELRQWIEKCLDLVANSIRPGEGKIKQEEIGDLLNELNTLLNTRPSIVRAWEDLERDWTEFKEAFYSDKVLKEFLQKFHHISSMMKTIFIEGKQEAKGQLKNIIKTLVQSVLPSVGQILGNIPLPRVEFTSENMDAVLDDIHISTVQLLPEIVRLTTTSDWLWQSNSNKNQQFDTDFRLFLGGFRLNISDISFYVQERFTAPSENACGQCCSFGRSDSDWCLFRGPASWFAYTESALLDVGFKDKGLGVLLDLRDAGQDVRKRSNNSSWWSKWFWSSTSEEQDQTKDQLDEIIQRYQTREEQATIKEASIRNSFFTIKECKIELNDSFDFKLRNSRHWLLNTFFRWTSKPLIKLLLSRIISVQIQNAFSIADQRAYDLHLRAKLVRHRKECSRLLSNETTSSSKMPLVSECYPGLIDYFSVLMDDEAGKSKERIVEENKQKREREREARKKEEEEIQTKQSQPKPEKQMEIRPTGLVYHDEQGDYSISLGVKPSGMLLDERQHGPKTQRMRIREAIANPKRTAEEVGQRGRYLHEEAKKSLQGERQQPGETQDQDRDLLDIPRAVTKNAKQSLETVQEAVAAISGNVITTEEQNADWDRDNGWKSSAFDL